MHTRVCACTCLYVWVCMRCASICCAIVLCTSMCVGKRAPGTHLATGLYNLPAADWRVVADLFTVDFCAICVAGLQDGRHKLGLMRF